MRTTRILTFLAVVAAGLAASAAPAMAQPTVLFTRLSGAAVPGGGDPNGSGFGLVLVDDETNQVCAAVIVLGVDGLHGAHVHYGSEGEVGGHAVDLADPVHGFSYSCHTASEAVVDQLIANPAGFYLNVHSHEFPGGAVRGQLASIVPAT
ncbi:MAG: CHRD domain-containing protein [Actinomycetota bacterium]|nr:CHRD domain-containing protein [Actinomycetota bacterium]